MKMIVVFDATKIGVFGAICLVFCTKSCYSVQIIALFLHGVKRNAYLYRQKTI